MSTVKEIESALVKLTLDEKQAVRDLLDDLIEAQLEVSEVFKAKVERAKQEIAVTGRIKITHFGSNQNHPPWWAVM